MRPRLRLCGFAVIGALALAIVAPPVAAAPARDPVAEAREHYELGTRLYDIGRYEEALDEYEKAYRAKPDPALLYNIAVCHRKLGHAQQALDAYRSFLRRQPKSPRRESVERTIATLEQEIAEATKTPAPAEVAPPPPAPPPPAAAPEPRPEVSLAARAEPAAEPPPPLLHRPWVWVAAAAVVAGAVVGIALATSKTDRVFSCPDCQGTRAVP
jgi:tetratricopeptide (TPR) repeat protein